MVSTMIVTDIPFHEAANIFPLDEEHIAELAVDIQRNGQQVPIELIDGKIVDGRRRYLACQSAEVEPKFKTVAPEDPVSYVVSINLHRRHLSPAQLSMVAARVRSIYDEQAKARQTEILKKGQEIPVRANLPERENGRSRDKAGAAVGVSGKSVDHATRVLNHGIPEVVKAVDAGKMAVSTAALISTQPAEVQLAEVTDHLRRMGPKKLVPKKVPAEIAPQVAREVSDGDLTWAVIAELHALLHAPVIVVPYQKIKKLVIELRDVYRQQHRDQPKVAKK